MDLVAQNILEKAVAPKLIKIITSSAKAGFLIIPGLPLHGLNFFFKIGVY